MQSSYLEPTQESGAALFSRDIPGELIMLNLLRFRDQADYSATPELAPEEPITGREAFQKYVEHANPYLKERGGRLLFLGEGGPNLIGPPEERWDLVMLIRHRSMEDFKSFLGNKEYKSGLGHRTAALEDSRLLPIQKTKTFDKNKAEDSQ